MRDERGVPVRDERGSAALETVILVPGFMLFIALMVAGARLHLARGEVVDAAAGGARAASLEVSAAAASRAAREHVVRELHGTCSPVVATDTVQFARPVGTAARVSVQVRCEVGFTDVVLPGLPGRIVVTGEADQILDSYSTRR